MKTDVNVTYLSVFFVMKMLVYDIFGLLILCLFEIAHYNIAHKDLLVINYGEKIREQSILNRQHELMY